MKYSSITILTGAGISQESGIKTFRDQNGLWENHAIEDVACPKAFKRNPELVHSFYNLRRNQLLEKNISFNKAHKILAQIELEFKGQFTLITQNIDNLHEKAGSNNIIHMHGELLKKRCLSCEFITDVYTDLNQDSQCTNCNQQSNLRPHIVWFGEMPLEMDRIFANLQKTELFVSIGTSSQVYPAAQFVEIAKDNNAYTIELNLERTAMSDYYDLSLQGKATELCPKLYEIIFG